MSLGRAGSIATVVTVTAALISAAASAGPPPANVKVKDNRFKPDSVNQILGSSTFFTWADSVENRHNARQDVRLFRTGDPTDDPGANYSFVIPAGTFPYFCEVHGSKRSGMGGVVRVRPTFSKGVMLGTIVVRWEDGGTIADQFDVRYRINKREYRPWLTDTTESSAVFGNGDPVDLKPGKTYTFQARTELNTDPVRRSGWSPKLVVGP